VHGERKGKAVPINITVDEGLLAAIDKVAENRFGFLADAARVALAARRRGWKFDAVAHEPTLQQNRPQDCTNKIAIVSRIS